MLALTRKQNQTIVVDDIIRITVIEIRSGQVRLAIEAPREIPIMREELLPTVTTAVTAV